MSDVKWGLVELVPLRILATRRRANINAGTMLAEFPDGTRLETRPLLFGYHDPVDNRTVVLSTLTGGVGWLVESNVVIYSNCFSGGIKASIRFRNNLGGPAQDLILHEQLPGPEEFGLSSSSRLELLTELFGETPTPRQQERIIRGEPNPARRALMREPDFRDMALDFGGVRMTEGRAFSEGSGASDRAADVGKFYYVNRGDNRRVLIEASEYQSIRPMLTNLPPARAEGARSAAVQPRRVLPVSRMAGRANSDERIQIAALSIGTSTLRPLAFVSDFQAVSGGFDGYTFAGNTNYLIANNATVTLTGATVVEGGYVSSTAT